MASDLETHKSINMYVIKVAGGEVCWCSRLQKIVAVSTTEAEYISATDASTEVI